MTAHLETPNEGPMNQLLYVRIWMADFVNQFIFSFELSWLDMKFIFSEHIHARKYEDIANNSFKDNETFYLLLVSNA